MNKEPQANFSQEGCSCRLCKYWKKDSYDADGFNIEGKCSKLKRDTFEYSYCLYFYRTEDE
jgi:hypothetical protein